MFDVCLISSIFCAVGDSCCFGGHIMNIELAGGDIRQKLEFHHVHLELGALGYVETFLFYWSFIFFKKKTTMADFRF